MRLALLVICFVFCFVPEVYSDIYHCHGRWTNVPCGPELDTRTNTNTNVKKPHYNRSSRTSPSASSSEPLAPRLQAFRSLRKENEKYEKEGKKTLSRAVLSEIKSYCMKMSNPFSQCQEKCSEKKAELAKMNEDSMKDLLGDLE